MAAAAAATSDSSPPVPGSEAAGYQWAYSIMDSSRVSTFFISILLIVYGSFRSLALEEDKECKLTYFDASSQKECIKGQTIVSLLTTRTFGYISK